MKVIFPNIHLTVNEAPVQIVQVAYHSKSAAFVPQNLYFNRLDRGLTSVESVSLKKKYIVSTSIVYKILENIFIGIVSQNVENVFFISIRNVSPKYFLLDKKIRIQFKSDIEPFLSEFIKAKKKLNLKRCLLLANKGIEFPFKLREYMKKLYI